MSEKYVLTSREITILHELSKREYTEKNILLNKCHIKDRTLRKDIENLNFLLGEKCIFLKKNRGYYIKNKAVFADFLNKSEITFVENRDFYIMRKMILSQKGVNIFDLAEELFVSEATIEKDIVNIKQKVFQYSNLSLKREKEIIRLEGDEKVRRSLLCELMLDESMNHNFDVKLFNKCFINVNLEDIEYSILKIFNKYSIHFDDALLLNIILHIAIAVERRLELKEQKSQHIILSQDIDTQISLEIIELLKEKYHISLLDDELEYLALLIKGKRTFIKNRNLENNVPYIQFINKIIDYIYDIYNIDFHDDQELYQDLSLHIQGMIKRITESVPAHNVLLDEIKKNYPFIFEVGVDIAEQYRKMTKLIIDESEIGYIVLHLVCAFERLNSQGKKLKVIIVCPTGYTSSKLLEIKLSNAFGDKINIVNIYGLNELYTKNVSNLDLIISTVPLDDMKIPVIVCSSFLLKKDIEEIEIVIHNLQKQKFLFNKINYFEEELFFCNQELFSKKDVLYFLSHKLVEKGYVDNHYYQSVLEREKLSSTAYCEGIAIPHAMEMNAKKTIIAVCLLKKPIKWGKYKVSIIFQLSFKNNDKKQLFNLYEKLALLTKLPKQYEMLLQSKDYKTFITLFDKI